jgi:hypothetical protein
VGAEGPHLLPYKNGTPWNTGGAVRKNSYQGVYFIWPLPDFHSTVLELAFLGLVVADRVSFPLPHRGDHVGFHVAGVHEILLHEIDRLLQLREIRLPDVGYSRVEVDVEGRPLTVVSSSFSYSTGFLRNEFCDDGVDTSAPLRQKKLSHGRSLYCIQMFICK